jgi:hypothetical protein
MRRYPMKHARNNRRTFLAGMIAAIGAGLGARTAFAFPPGTQGLVQAATSILQRFGVSVAATGNTETNRDVLTFTVTPSDEIQYDQIVNSSTGETCWITSSFRDFVEFTNFAMATGQPELKIASQGGQSVIELLDPQAHIRVTIAGGATYELQDGELVIVDE